MFSHSFFRYIPSNDERRSFFKFVEKIDTTDDNVPKIDDHNCIDVVTNNENGQIRIKNHSAPEYSVSKYVGWTLFLPPVEKQNKEPIFVVFKDYFEIFCFNFFVLRLEVGFSILGVIQVYN